MKAVHALVAILIVLLALVYAPIIAGWPRGWPLYAYWLLTGLAAMAVAWYQGWGVRDG